MNNCPKCDSNYKTLTHLSMQELPHGDAEYQRYAEGYHCFACGYEWEEFSFDHPVLGNL